MTEAAGKHPPTIADQARVVAALLDDLGDLTPEPTGLSVTAGSNGPNATVWWHSDDVTVLDRVEAALERVGPVDTRSDHDYPDLAALIDQLPRLVHLTALSARGVLVSLALLTPDLAEASS